MGDSGEINDESQTVANAGYHVVSINYELANPGLSPGQTCHADDVQMAGYWVNREKQDVEAFITALRADSTVKADKIGIVGGSAGATLAALAVLDTTSTGSDWPYWSASARPVCAVLLSAAYDFSDRTPSDESGGSTPGGMDTREIRVIENFTQTVDPMTHLADPIKQKDLSPVSKVKPPTVPEPFVPLLMVHSMYDPTVPHHQLDDMLCALQSNGIDPGLYQVIELPYNDLHSFHYWGTCDDFNIPCTTVSQDVITFLDAHLK